MSWMVTGGAGYIGAHVVRAFEEVGLDVVVVDDLSSGHREFVHDEVPFVDGSIVDTELMERTMSEHDVEGVVHLAGYKYAGVSVEPPAAHLHPERHRHGQPARGDGAHRRGQDGVLLERRDVRHARRRPGHRGDRDAPRVAVRREQADRRVGDPRPGPARRGLRHTSLRYFNVVGSGADDLYDTSPHNLFPIVFEKLLAGETPRINGDDYDTPDGTCVRDYVHVGDLAISHVVAAQRLAGRRRAAARLQPRQRHRLLGRRDHERDPHRHRHRLHPRRSARVDPATRPASWRPARPPPATSTGRCATTSRTWSARPGRPAATPLSAPAMIGS